MFSLSRSKAGLISRLADFLQYRKNENSPIGGFRYLGDATVSQTSKGVFYPTVQSAIDDLSHLYELPIGTVIMNDTGNPPTAISQSDQWKFDGIVFGEPTEDIMIYVFGIPVKVKGGDTAIAVAQKAYDELLIKKTENLYFKDVAIDTVDTTILNITYSDQQDHVFEPDVQYGITQTQTTVVAASQAYGGWDWLGSAEVNLVGGSSTGPKTIYYFKRES